MSRRSQHLRRALLEDWAKWAAYMPMAVEEARRSQVSSSMKKVAA